MDHLIQLRQPYTNKARIVCLQTCQRTQGDKLWKSDLARTFSQTICSKAARWKTSRVCWNAGTPINKIMIPLSLRNGILTMPLTRSAHFRSGMVAQQDHVAGQLWKHTSELGTFNLERQQEGMRQQREAYDPNRPQLWPCWIEWRKASAPNGRPWISAPSTYAVEFSSEWEKAISNRAVLTDHCLFMKIDWCGM